MTNQPQQNSRPEPLSKEWFDRQRDLAAERLKQTTWPLHGARPTDLSESEIFELHETRKDLLLFADSAPEDIALVLNQAQFMLAGAINAALSLRESTLDTQVRRRPITTRAQELDDEHFAYLDQLRRALWLRAVSAPAGVARKLDLTVEWLDRAIFLARTQRNRFDYRLMAASADRLVS